MSKPWIWLRALAVVFAFFTIGHTIGFLKPPAPGSPASAVLETMQRVHFPAMGVDRSYAEFYRGFGLFVSLEFAFLGVLALQVAAISRRDPRQALPLAVTLLTVCVGSTVLSWVFFFAAPIVTSLVAVLCSSAALATVARDSRRQLPQR